MSQYARYIKEREDTEIIEDCYGFATYRFIDPTTCYIVDIFVDESHRNLNIAAEYADCITEIARKRGCHKLLGSVCPTAKSATASMKVLLAYGFKLDSYQNGLIIFSKEIN